MCVPALRGQSIRPEDLLRHPDSHSLEEAPSSKRGKKNKGISEATRGPLTAAFHPSMTIMGVQPCVMVASAKGTVVKWNHVLERGTVVYGESCAHTEPSNPNLEPGTLMNSDTDARTVKREFYEFHDCRILLLGFLEHGSLTMITLDDKGHLAIWPYSADHFSGFMWHDPAEISTLDLTLDEFVASPQPAASLFTFTTKKAADSHLVEFGELELKVPTLLSPPLPVLPVLPLLGAAPAAPTTSGAPPPFRLDNVRTVAPPLSSYGVCILTGVAAVERSTILRPTTTTRPPSTSSAGITTERLPRTRRNHAPTGAIEARSNKP